MLCNSNQFEIIMFKIIYNIFLTRYYDHAYTDHFLIFSTYMLTVSILIASII